MDEDKPVGQVRNVLDTDELLARLEARGIRNVEIAKVLGLPDTRVPEIKRKARALKLDEAVRLVRAFELEQEFRAAPLPLSVVRLVVLHIAAELGVSPTDQQLEDLSQDVRAFAAFVADPKIRRSVEAAEGFFRALQLRRPEPEAEAQPETDPDRVR